MSGNASGGNNCASSGGAIVEATDSDGSDERPEVQWTNPALEQVKLMTPAQCGGKDPKKFHEEHVRKHARKNAPSASRARIRRTAHSGGQNPAEPEHITVTYKDKNRDLGTWHVYTKSSDATS